MAVDRPCRLPGAANLLVCALASVVDREGASHRSAFQRLFRASGEGRRAIAAAASPGGRAAAGPDGRVRLYAMACGRLSADIGMMLGRERGLMRFPVPARPIRHPKGLVLLDTGLHPDSRQGPQEPVGPLAEHFQVHFRPGKEIGARLERLGIDPARIDYVVNSHLHFDRGGGNELVPNARIVVQRCEWKAGSLPELMEANAHNPHGYDHGHLAMQIDGEHDLFGDGSVVTVPTCEHAPGHRSLKVRLASGDVVLVADACYFRRMLEEMHLPKLVCDRAAMLDSRLFPHRLRPYLLRPRPRLLERGSAGIPREHPARRGCALRVVLYKGARKGLQDRERGNRKGSISMTSTNHFDESGLTKGQLRKLNALRKSVGSSIAERAFSEWLSSQATLEAEARDRNAERIAEALWDLVQSGKLTIRRGGYLVRRGRGRVVVGPAAE